MLLKVMPRSSCHGEMETLFNVIIHSILSSFLDRRDIDARIYRIMVY